MWDTFDDIAESQGWSTSSQFTVLFDFIASRELGKELAQFAQGVADTENGDDLDMECPNCETPAGQPCPPSCRL